MGLFRDRRGSGKNVELTENTKYVKKNYSGLFSKSPKKQQKAAEQYNAVHARRGLTGTKTENNLNPSDSKSVLKAPPGGNSSAKASVSPPPGY
jgi:hypothetical protein